MLSQTTFPFPPLISFIDNQPSEASETKKLAALMPLSGPSSLPVNPAQRSLASPINAGNPPPERQLYRKIRGNSYLLPIPGGQVDSRTTNSGSTTIRWAAFTPAPDPICCNTV
jgi:hypothetical protein